MDLQQHYQALLKQAIAGSVSDDQDGLTGESQTLALQLESMDLEIQRLSDMADGLNDAVCALEGLEHADKHHLMLLESCLNLAASGTPVTAQDIQPALESYLNLTISTEGVVEKVKALIAFIVRLVREMWYRIHEWFEALFNEVSRARFRLRYVETLVNEIDGKEPTRERVALGPTVFNLMTEKGAPNDARNVVVPMVEIIKQTRHIREHAVPKLMNVGQGLSAAIGHWPNDPERNAQWLESLNQIARQFDPHHLASAMGLHSQSHKQDYPSGTVIDGTMLPGMRSLRFIDGMRLRPAQDSSDPIEVASALQENKIILERIRDRDMSSLAGATMAPLSNDNLQEILGLVDNLLDEVETAVQAGFRQKLERLGRDMKDAASRINPNTTEGYAYLEKGLRYERVYASWVRGLYVDLIAHDLIVCRAALSFVARHCAAYAPTN